MRSLSLPSFAALCRAALTRAVSVAPFDVALTHALNPHATKSVADYLRANKDKFAF